MTEREEIVERLRGVRLVEDSSFNTERIAAAICDYRGNILAELPLDECKKVRDKLIGLLTETPAATSGERVADELRHLATEWDWMDPEAGEPARKLRAIADRIDEEHKKAMDDSYRDGYQEGKRDGDDDWYEEHEAYLEEHGWYQALDADKEPIKFGDEVEWRHPNGSCELRHGIVVGIKTDKINDEMFHEVTVKVDRFTTRLMANQLRHYHKQSTVEDLLQEFAGKWRSSASGGKKMEIIAQYAAKLQLRSDAE